MFAVVEFKPRAGRGSEVAIVPQIWLTKNDKTCYWPNRIGQIKFDEFVKKKIPYKTSWPTFKVLKIHLKTGNYDVADQKVNDILHNEGNELSSSSVGSIGSLSRKEFQELSETSSCSDNDESPNPKRSRTLTPNITLTARSDPPIQISAPANSITAQTNLSANSITAQPNLNFQVILPYLVELKDTMNQHTAILCELRQFSRQANAYSIEARIDSPNFPINKLNELVDFDKKLIKDEPITKFMISKLASIGGGNLDSHTRRILKYLITDEVATNYNWKGRDKLSFEKTNLMAVIYDSTKLHYPVSERNELNVANAVKDWLKFAKTRLNSSKQGRSRQSLENNSNEINNDRSEIL